MAPSFTATASPSESPIPSVSPSPSQQDPTEEIEVEHTYTIEDVTASQIGAFVTQMNGIRAAAGLQPVPVHRILVGGETFTNRGEVYLRHGFGDVDSVSADSRALSYELMNMYTIDASEDHTNWAAFAATTFWNSKPHQASLYQLDPWAPGVAGGPDTEGSWLVINIVQATDTQRIGDEVTRKDVLVVLAGWETDETTNQLPGDRTQDIVQLDRYGLPTNFIRAIDLVPELQDYTAPEPATENLLAPDSQLREYETNLSVRDELGWGTIQVELAEDQGQ